MYIYIYNINIKYIGINYGYPQEHTHKQYKKLQKMQKTYKIIMFFSTYFPCPAILMLRGSMPVVRIKKKKNCLVRKHL